MSWPWVKYGRCASVMGYYGPVSSCVAAGNARHARACPGPANHGMATRTTNWQPSRCRSCQGCVPHAKFPRENDAFWTYARGEASAVAPGEDADTLVVFSASIPNGILLSRLDDLRSMCEAMAAPDADGWRDA
jgi:hypothetical protein